MAFRKIDSADLIGLKVGRLTVTSVAFKKNSAWHYHCSCTCGQTVVVIRASLRHAKQRSCGCLLKEYREELATSQRGKPSKNAKAPGEASFNVVWNTYKQGAKQRDLSFDLTKADFKNLILQNCYYCGNAPNNITKHACALTSFTHTGVDRSDSNQGYSLSNCVPCCKTCNYMKHELSEKDFYAHILKIVDFKNLKD